MELSNFYQGIRCSYSVHVAHTNALPWWFQLVIAPGSPIFAPFLSFTLWFCQGQDWIYEEVQWVFSFWQILGLVSGAGSLPNKTRVLRQIAPESSPKRSATSLSHSFFVAPNCWSRGHAERIWGGRNFSANFDGEMFLRIFRPCCSRASGPLKKIHAQNRRHSYPISVPNLFVSRQFSAYGRHQELFLDNRSWNIFGHQAFSNKPSSPW